MRVVRSDQIKFQPASHEDPANPGVLKKVLAVKDEILDGRVQMINWARLPHSSSFRPHYHEDMQEIFVVIHGTASMRVGSETIQLAPGDAVFVDPHEVHEMVNVGDGDVEYLVVGVSLGKKGKTVVV